jgi:DNA-binding NarL/FixJ family response regulator
LHELTCVLVDDNEPILTALATLLRQEGIDIVGTARSGTEALRLLEQQQPATLVVDIRLPDLSGIEVARRVRDLSDSSPAVIVYTSYADRSIVASAFDAGARAVVLKDAPPRNLLEAIEIVAAGGTYIDAGLRTGPRHL